MPTITRANVWTVPPGDETLTWYATGVAAMQERSRSDPADPTGWAYQAAIHGTRLTRAEWPLPSPPWDQCRHGTWNFPPWHRMYVLAFETIVRAHVVAAGGPADWALPYWDYAGPRQEPSLPHAFRRRPEGGMPNALYVEERAAGINEGALLPSSVTDAKHAMDRLTYTGKVEFGGGRTAFDGQFHQQTGALENKPHNVVHNAVGGKHGLMGNPQAAAGDPIFWLHHANIDRLWWLWRQQPDRSDPTDQDWLTSSFTFFAPDGSSVSWTIAEVLDCESLGYTYEAATMPADAGPPPSPAPLGGDDVTWPEPFPQLAPAARRARGIAAPAPELVGASEAPATLTGDAVTRTVAIDRRATQQAVRAFDASAPPHAYLSIDDIEGGEDPGTVYGIYLNLPADPTPADLAAHQATTMSFFGIERARDPRGDEHAHGLHLTTDVTGLLDRLAAVGDWQDGGRLEVTFRPIALEAPPDQPELAAALAAETAHPDRPISIGRVSLAIA